METSKCDKECEVYSRIVGYYRPINMWNKGKVSEWESRVVFKEEFTQLNGSKA